MKNAPLYFARLGAISYIVWALLHFIAALSVYRLGQTMPGTMAQARVFQDAWNLACFSISAIGVALTMNWRNDEYGYWINLAIISVADIGFIAFVLIPGYLPIWPGLAGPLFWIVGLLLTSAARLKPIPPQQT
jgi:hypothetical protein